MTWEQKLAACQALAECSLKMRKPGDWYVSQPGVDVKDATLLRHVSGNGESPELAVEEHFARLTVIHRHQYVVVNAGGEKRHAVRWNGFMWQQVEETQSTPEYR